MIGTVHMPRILRIGGGAAAGTAEVLEKLGLSRPLVVSDKTLVGLGHVARVTDVLDRAGIRWSLFDGVVEDPTDVSLEAGLEAFRAGDFDCVIGLGGGSSMDTAKAISFMHVNDGHVGDYRQPRQIDRCGPPLILIPTTGGTGSEVTRWCVVTDTRNDEKLNLSGLACVATAAIVDYEFTFTKPYRLTADTAIDCLTHAIEAYVSARAFPYTDTYALSAMRLIARNIRTACAEPDNAAAREAMMLGATQAGVAFSNASVALVHGMSRPIGAFFHVPHGLSNAMLLPAVTAFSVDAAEARYADCARAMGVAEESTPDGVACGRLVEALRRLNDDLSVPSPKAYGIDEGRYMQLMPLMAEQALASGSPGNNPKVPTKDEIVEIYREIWE